MLTGTVWVLGARVPKNGLGVVETYINADQHKSRHLPYIMTHALSRLGLGRSSRCCIGTGRLNLYEYHQLVWLLKKTLPSIVTGLKAFAFGLGLNDDALTFKRAADVGDVGTTSTLDAFEDEPEV